MWRSSVLLSLACTVLAASTAVVTARDAPVQAAQQLQLCYNERYNSTQTTFQAFLRSQPYSMYLHHIWWTAQQPQLQLTVVTALTASRLSALEAQCASWDGPLSAAVYVVLLQSRSEAAPGKLTSANEQLLAAATAAVAAVFSRQERHLSSATQGSIDRGGGCQLVIQLLYELVAEEEVTYILPINALRNAAMLPAKTPLVAMVDVDLLLSSSLSRQLQDPARAQALQNSCIEKQQVFVLPAFETYRQVGLAEGLALVKDAIAGGKDCLQSAVSQGLLHAFAAATYARGHASTNTSRWLNTSSAYSVEYAINYEPWFIIARNVTPPYDARFRGYGWNKVAQVAHVNATGFTFVVHESAFLLHQPHAKSGAQGFYKVATARSDPATDSTAAVLSPAKLFHRKVSALRHVAVRDMARRVYVPVVDGQSSHCFKTLPWWRGTTAAA